MSIRITPATFDDQKVAIKSSLARISLYDLDDGLLRSLDHIGDAKWHRLIEGLQAFYLANPAILKASFVGIYSPAHREAILNEIRTLIQ